MNGRPDLLYPFPAAHCPRCLCRVVVDPVWPTVCPSCDVPITRPVDWSVPPAPSQGVADRPPTPF